MACMAAAVAAFDCITFQCLRLRLCLLRQGTVLIKSAAELTAYSKSEEEKLGQLIQASATLAVF